MRIVSFRQDLLADSIKQSKHFRNKDSACQDKFQIFFFGGGDSKKQKTMLVLSIAIRHQALTSHHLQPITTQHMFYVYTIK